jgi:hypothetical protein
MADTCDCEHHTHDPSGVGRRAPDAHEFGDAGAVTTVRSPWGGTFRLCQACIDAGHMQGTQFR